MIEVERRLAEGLQARAELARPEPDLDAVLGGHRRTPAGHERARDRSSRTPRLAMAAATIVALALCAYFVAARGVATVTPSDHRPGDDPTPGTPPNGLIAFVGAVESINDPIVFGYNFVSDIFVVDPDGTRPRNVTATADLNEMAPTFSRDGTRLAFLRDVHHGAARLVVVDPVDGAVLSDLQVPLHRNTDPWAVVWSPDGRAALVRAGNSPDWVVDLATGDWQSAPQGTTWSPDGELVRSRDGAQSPDGVSSAVEVDADTSNDLTSAGGYRTPVYERIDLLTATDSAPYGVIDDGFAPVWSPDGAHLAYLSDPRPGIGAELWVTTADGTRRRRLATSMIEPLWSPDGRWLLGEDAGGLFAVRSDGSEPVSYSLGVPTGDLRPFLAPGAQAAGLPKLSPTWQLVTEVD